ncbi:MAG: efflux RND transporter periplasmic adaptor subunit [Candidatus Tectomicrobia bacterium]|nr:efflux RND transporter periplasmic adaptor subunit [Candidatus Tectomicrobia bacterium]
MKRFVVILAAVVMGTTFYWYARPTADVKLPDIFEVAKRDFIIKHTVVGELRALDSVTISAQKDLPIIYLIPEGTQVQKGELLVRFDPDKYEAAYDQSLAAFQVAQADQQKAAKDLEAQRHKLFAELARFEAEVRLAQLDLEALKRKPLPDELERARLELKKAQTVFNYAKKRRNVLPGLVDKGYITQGALEEAQLKFLEAGTIRQSARFNFDKVAAGATADELVRAQIRLEQAQIALERAQRGMQAQLQSFEASVEREKANVESTKRMIDTAKVKLNRTDLHAPKEGLVVYATVGGERSSVKVQLGMIPFEGQPILYLPDLSTMVVDIEVNEIDIGKIKIGGPVEVGLETYPDTTFRGQILQIGSLARLKQIANGTASSIKVFDTTVQIEDADPRLKPGLTATLDIIIDRQKDALSVPLSAVISRGEEDIVFVVNAGKVEPRKIVCGLSNEHRVRVKEGLRLGERVILAPSPSERL